MSKGHQVCLNVIKCVRMLSGVSDMSGGYQVFQKFVMCVRRSSGVLEVCQVCQKAIRSPGMLIGHQE